MSVERLLTVQDISSLLRQHRDIQKSQGFLSEYVFTYEGKRTLWGVDIGFNNIVKRQALKT